MPNITSAKKRARQNVKLREHNMARRSRMRSAIKKFRLLAASDPEQASKAYGPLSALLDRAARKHLIHRNKAARLKSRLSRRLGRRSQEAPASS